MSMKQYANGYILFLILSLGIFSCAQHNDANGTYNPQPRIIVRGKGSVIYMDYTFEYVLLQLDIPGKQSVYAQWFPSILDRKQPAMLLTDPYGIISWDGFPHKETVKYITPEEVFMPASVYLFNGFSVLTVFGRFYADNTIQDNVDYIHTGLNYLATRTEVALDSIGIYGKSWGGFQALFGSANAPDRARPAYGVALYPPSDFEEVINYVRDVQLPMIETEELYNYYIDFFAPYAAKVFAAANGDYSKWNRSFLQKELRTKFLVVHEEWDLVVPFNLSVALADDLSDRVKYLWYLKGSAVDYNDLPFEYGHGHLRAYDEDLNPYSIPFYSTLTSVWLMTKLSKDTRTLFIPVDNEALVNFLQYLKDYKDTGIDMEWAAELLADLCDTRISLVNVDPPHSFNPGTEVLSTAINSVWGTTLTPETVATELLSQGLPPY